MNNNTLPLVTPAQFVKTWIPDYENRLCRFLGGNAQNPVTITSFGQRAFTTEYFPEALAAFEAHIRQETWREACEAQRKECVKGISTYPLTMRDPHHRKFISELIMAAPIPEIPKNEKI